jgi:N utilization substance protein A
MVVSELRGEKIDIIPFNEEPARFVAKALSPARVREVLVDDESKQATVVVPDDQLSLAIGREGLNARLAARLTGWRIDIRSETEFAEEEAEGGYEEEAVAGRCAAILANGRRCPNAALPSSRYCGLPAHQALAETGSDYVAGEPPEGGELDDDGNVIDPDDAASAVEAGGAETGSERGLDDDVEEVAADVADSEFEETDIDSVDVERVAGDDSDETEVTEAELESDSGDAPEPVLDAEPESADDPEDAADADAAAEAGAGTDAGAGDAGAGSGESDAEATDEDPATAEDES